MIQPFSFERVFNKTQPKCAHWRIVRLSCDDDDVLVAVEDKDWMINYRGESDLKRRTIGGVRDWKELNCFRTIFLLGNNSNCSTILH